MLLFIQLQILAKFPICSSLYAFSRASAWAGVSSWSLDFPAIPGYTCHALKIYEHEHILVVLSSIKSKDIDLTNDVRMLLLFLCWLSSCRSNRLLKDLAAMNTFFDLSHPCPCIPYPFFGWGWIRYSRPSNSFVPTHWMQLTGHDYRNEKQMKTSWTYREWRRDLLAWNSVSWSELSSFKKYLKWEALV